MTRRKDFTRIDVACPACDSRGLIISTPRQQRRGVPWLRCPVCGMEVGSPVADAVLWAAEQRKAGRL
jgi:DNA-directed RNA polymerase subunit RPC12/RpoP